jgi:hypothetical protein
VRSHTEKEEYKTAGRAWWSGKRIGATNVVARRTLKDEGMTIKRAAEAFVLCADERPLEGAESPLVWPRARR